MSGLFGGSSKAINAQMAAQEASNKAESERLKKQENQLAEEKTMEARRMMSQANARRRGGQRALLSAERPDAETGLPTLEIKI